MDIISNLLSRKLISKSTIPSSKTLYNIIKSSNKPISAYLGIDPTSDGLHLGHYIAITTMKKFQEFNITPIFLVF